MMRSESTFRSEKAPEALTQPLHVMMVSDNLIKGGRERRMLELLKGLSAQPQVSLSLVLLSERIDYPEIHQLPVRLHIAPQGSKRDLGLVSWLWKLCQAERPDILHCWGSLSALLVSPIAKLQGRVLVNATVADAPAHVSLAHKHFLRSRFTFPLADAIIGNSQAGLDAYRAPARKSSCIHNGFDFRRIERLEAPEAVRERFGIRTPLVVGMVGAFEPRKDYATYLEAAQRLVSARPDVSFLAIGGGNTLEAHREAIPEALRPRILFTGVQNGVEAIMNVFTVGVLTTNQDKHGEGISNAIMEYMALGKPVVATRGGGTGEIVLDGETGLLIPAKDPGALVAALESLLDQPEEARRMGEAGRQRVQAHFNLRDMTGKYISIYRKVSRAAAQAV